MKYEITADDDVFECDAADIDDAVRKWCEHYRELYGPTDEFTDTDFVGIKEFWENCYDDVVLKENGIAVFVFKWNYK